MDTVSFYKEESFKDLNIKADCNYIVVGKKHGGSWRILPYSIWYCDDNRMYVAVKVKQAQPRVNTVLDSNDHEEYTEAFTTLNSAKKWVYNDIMGAK